MCGTNQPSASPSRTVPSLGLAALTRCPVNRPWPAARLNATTCYAGASAYASLALISSDKSNVSRELTPLALTRRMTSILRGHVTPRPSRKPSLIDRPRPFSWLTTATASLWPRSAVKRWIRADPMGLKRRSERQKQLHAGAQ